MAFRSATSTSKSSIPRYGELVIYPFSGDFLDYAEWAERAANQIDGAPDFRLADIIDEDSDYNQGKLDSTFIPEYKELSRQVFHYLVSCITEGTAMSILERERLRPDFKSGDGAALWRAIKASYTEGSIGRH
jgi:hypothetical protein